MRSQSANGPTGADARATAAALVVALACAACPGVPAVVERPRVTVRSASIVVASTAGLRVSATVTVTNPNTIALPLRAIDWELSVGGEGPVRGRVDSAALIPARAPATVAATLSIHPGNAGRMLSRIASGARDYELAGVLHFETRLGDLAVPFDRTGELR